MKKKTCSFAALILALMLALTAFTGCGVNAGEGGSADSAGSEISEGSEVTPAAGPGEDTVTVTDSAGRTVEIPSEISRIAPSGTFAQMFLVTLCPEKLMGLSTPVTDEMKGVLPDCVLDLPLLGQFYGGNSDVSLEALIAAQPDIIIDVGERKNNVAGDMDALQEKTGIPVVFIETSFLGTPDTFTRLGEITGSEERGGELAEYCRNILDSTQKLAAQIEESDRVRVYLGDGESGTQPNPAGSVHSEAVEMIGAVNVAEIGESADSGAQDVSIEQIISWNPQVIVLYPHTNFDRIYDDEKWSSIEAVKNLQVYEVPEIPCNWLDRPPSIQRILGIQWLGNLLYPEVYDYDMTERTQEFFKVFFSRELSREDAESMLGNSTLS